MFFFFVNFISLKKFFTLSTTNLKLPLFLFLHPTLGLPKSEITDSAFFSVSISLFFFPHIDLPLSESVIYGWVVVFWWSWLAMGRFRSAQVGFRLPWAGVGPLVLMGGLGFAHHHIGLPLFELVISTWVVAFRWSWLAVGPLVLVGDRGFARHRSPRVLGLVVVAENGSVLFFFFF